jgi:hypothetical protein
MGGHFDTKVDRRTLLGILATAVFGQASLAQAQTTERAGMVTEVKGDAFAEAQNHVGLCSNPQRSLSRTWSVPGRTHGLRCDWVKTRPCIWGNSPD